MILENLTPGKAAQTQPMVWTISKVSFFLNNKKYIMYESECFRPQVSSVKRQIPSAATLFPAVCHSDAMQPLRSDHVISLNSLIVYVNDLILNTNWSR